MCNHKCFFIVKEKYYIAVEVGMGSECEVSMGGIAHGAVTVSGVLPTVQWR